MNLDPNQVRVLGALIEKEIVTPENYPISLNSLTAACNQKSSRDPVMDLSEQEVLEALHSLEDDGFVSVSHDSRVPKYEHHVRTILNLRRDETAILCLLMLRGPQTPGELRGRAERMYSFDGIEAVESTLGRLMNTPDPSEDVSTPERAVRPLVGVLPRQPGSREARYAQLLGGAFEGSNSSEGVPSAASARGGDGPQNSLLERVSKLEDQVAAIQESLAELQAILNRQG